MTHEPDDAPLPGTQSSGSGPDSAERSGIVSADGPPDTPSDRPVWIERNVELALTQLAGHVDFPFGLDRRSLVWVEGFLERQRANPEIDAEQLVPVLGSFLGQCLVENGAGHWVEHAEGWCVHSPRIDAFPFAKVAKQARDGVDAGESIVSFYDTTFELMTAHIPPR